MQTIGKILWWDRRDQEGVTVDALGNQYYFNVSVILSSSLSKMKDGQYVQFDVSSTLYYAPSAINITTLADPKGTKF